MPAACSPVQQQLQHRLRAGEGSVRGQEDGGVGEVVVAERRQQRLHQALKRSGADAADFARLQLADRVAWRQPVALGLNAHTHAHTTLVTTILLEDQIFPCSSTITFMHEEQVSFSCLYLK